MELWREFQGATVAESNTEDNPVHLVRLLFLEAANQLRLELWRKFQGAKLSHPAQGGCSGDQVAERENLAEGEGDEGGVGFRADSKELPEEEGELLY